MKSSGKVFDGDEFDLLGLLMLIWNAKAFIIKLTSVFVVIGVIVAFTTPVEYTASGKLISESQEGSKSNLGGLSGLAGLAGFDFNSLSSSNTISPELFPEIAKSSPFINKLIHEPIYFENKDSLISSFNYLKVMKKKSLFEILIEYTVGLPNKIKSLFIKTDSSNKRNYDLIRYSKEDWKLYDEFASRYSVSIDDNSGIISVSAEMPDVVASAQIANLIVNELTREIVSYQLEKAESNYKFIEARYLEFEEEYKLKQRKLAQYSDRNRNISNPIIQTEYTRLQNELSIVFEVYKGLASQLEQAKIKMKEITPTFMVLEPIRIPIDKSKPKRGLIIMIASFIGILCGIIYSIVKVNFLSKEHA